MTAIPLQPELFANVKDKIAIVTGAAGGIGAETVRVLHQNGAKVVLADLPVSQAAAQSVIASLSDPEGAHFIPANISKWDEMQALFKAAIKIFGRVDIVVANAGLMESKPFFEFETDETGDLKEPVESHRIIDVNLKGTMNSTRIHKVEMTRTDNP
jgi:NAD(P)-dependent dehydrogenase (short-subunit alcohol dehydrogenase family)